MRYSTDLRSMTQGRGTYTIQFDHYEPVPSHLAQEIIAQHKEEGTRSSAIELEGWTQPALQGFSLALA